MFKSIRNVTYIALALFAAANNFYLWCTLFSHYHIGIAIHYFDWLGVEPSPFEMKALAIEPYVWGSCIAIIVSVVSTLTIYQCGKFLSDNFRCFRYLAH